MEKIKDRDKDLFKIKSVKPKDITGAGLTLSMGYILGPFIPFNKLKNWRFKNGKNKR